MTDDAKSIPCACCGYAIDGAAALLDGGARLHPQCDVYMRARCTREADEREAWTRFAAAAAERWGASALTTDVADALILERRKRWRR